MRSRDKIDVAVEKVKTDDGVKPWAVVRDRRVRGRPILLVPSFEDIHRMTIAIVYCEREKYRALPWDPADMVRRFYSRSVEESVRLLVSAKGGRVEQSAYEESWRKLEEEFFIPRRTTAPRNIANVSAGTVEIIDGWEFT